MTTIQSIARHFRGVHFGSNWTDVNLRDTLADVTWEEATTPIHNLNTIAVLVFHTNYYVAAVLKVLDGGSLEASDKFSFDLPPLASKADWEKLVQKALAEAALFADKVETMEEARLFEDFSDAKYGDYYRNINGIIEHTHYHLGQIALIKKMLRQK